MAACKDKQNIRFKRISQSQNKKVRYDGFTKDEICLIKTQKKIDQYEKELNFFWSNAPRTENGVVDWESLSEEKLDVFEHINKEKEKLMNKISKLEDKGLDLDKIMNVFMKLNINSMSY
jgi:hypothetical protein